MDFLHKQITINNIPDDYLSLVTEFRNIDTTQTQQLFFFIKTLPKNHHIYVIYDNDTNETIGSITLIIEQKIIHNFGFVCHIEDVIVRNKYHNKGVGTKLLNIAKEVALQHKCYKIILNCDNNLKNFYVKNNYFESSCEMRIELIDVQNSNNESNSSFVLTPEA